MPLRPRKAAESCIRRAQRFLDLANQRLPDSRVKNDLRRMAIVMAVAAVDTFMHAVVLSAVGSTAANQPGNALRAIDVTFGDLLDVVDKVVRARRERVVSRPRVQAKTVLHRRLLRVTYQSSEKIGQALAAAGVVEGWKKVAKELNERPTAVKEKLDHLVHRRNQVVHEGDLRRLVRPQRISFNRIKHRDVVAEVKWVRSLLDALDKVVA